MRFGYRRITDPNQNVASVDAGPHRGSVAGDLHDRPSGPTLSARVSSRTAHRLAGVTRLTWSTGERIDVGELS
jgi:hypothetical protein